MAGLWAWIDRGEDCLVRPHLIYLRPNFIASILQIIFALQLVFLIFLNHFHVLDGKAIGQSSSIPNKL